jgi:hypothetical protein
MVRFLLFGVISGILFVILDGAINANPLAQRLYKVYTPIAKTSLNPLAGIVIDLVFGLAMAGIFLLLFNSLPGESGLVKGLSFAAIAWFFRVVMYVASQWMMFTVPGKTLLYTLAAGFGEMIILGVLYGLILKPV